MAQKVGIPYQFLARGYTAFENFPRKAELANRLSFVRKPIAIYVYIYMPFRIKFMRYQIMLAYR